MMRRLIGWIDERTGAQRLLHETLYENIPSGARLRYVTGSMLVFAFAVQAITGIFLWMGYSPSSQTAYESVYYIQHHMTGGWLVRGVHHFMAQAMVVVMALHLLQVIWDGAYRAPREVNYWLGLVLMQLVLGLGLTGYLLPWDQKGYWATNVATNLATLIPFVGKDLQLLAVGGNEYGHHTLTRFFAMHAGVLPALLLIFLAGHIAVFRRHGITAKITPGRADEDFWPKQVLLDALGCLVLLSVVLLCVVHFDLSGVVRGNLPLAHRGAELGAPADPAEAYSAARPEWYYLFLFQLLKYFPGSSEIIGAIIIPGVVMTLLALLPLIGISRWGHRFSQAFIVLLLASVGVLTCLAWSDDYFVYLAQTFKLEGEQYEAKLAASRDFLQARADAAHEAERMHDLINRQETLPDGSLSEVRMIPRQGAVSLLRNDPLTRGPRLFKQHCASCHDYADAAGERPPGFDAPVASDKADRAPNLFGFASRGWIKGILDDEQIVSPAYFGNTNHKAGRMATWVKQHAEMLADDPQKQDDDVDAIAAALSAQARLRSQAEADAKDSALIQRGVGLIGQHCASCHRLGDDGQLGLAPDLTGYGSYEWMLGLVSDPTHERFYRMENDRMPSFAQDLAHPERNDVSIRELSLIVDWLRGQYYVKDDPAPVLPHTLAEAQQIVARARTVAEPRPEVVGGGDAVKETQLAHAERLFTENCAACHQHLDSAGRGIAAKNPTAPNLFGFGSRAWLAGLLDPERIAGPEYFGNTRHKEGEMVSFVQDDLGELDDEGKARIGSIVAALSAEAGLPAQAEADKKAEADGSLEKGREALAETFSNYACTDCHKFGDGGDLGSAPDLTGWGSKDWLARLITDPTHEAFYRDTNDRMPAFGAGGPGPKQPLLTAEQIDLLARWLRGEQLD
ncbi:MAG: cytochrome b N-terminal domain-containing protein [Pirellulaceae bacterium]